MDVTGCVLFLLCCCSVWLPVMVTVVDDGGDGDGSGSGGELFLFFFVCHCFNGLVRVLVGGVFLCGCGMDNGVFHRWTGWFKVASEARVWSGGTRRAMHWGRR